MEVKAIRSGNGVGDNLYLQAIVKHLIKTTPYKYRVHTRYPSLFVQFGGRVEIKPFQRENIDIVAHYTNRKGRPGTTQFQDMCENAGIKEPVSLTLDWKVGNRGLIERIRGHANGKKLLLVQLPRETFGRNDGYGRELMPDYSVMDRIVGHLVSKHNYFAVQIGCGKVEYRLKNISYDLAEKTQLEEVFDLSSAADLFIGQTSFFIPLSECFDKKCIIVWSSKGLKSPTAFLSSVTPQKILHKKTCKAVTDDSNFEKIKSEVDEFLNEQA